MRTAIMAFIISVIAGYALGTVFVAGPGPSGITIQHTSIIAIEGHRIQLQNDPNKIDLIITLRIH